MTTAAAAVREVEGRAGPLAALLIEGLGDGPEGRPLLAGITTAARSFRWRDRAEDARTADAFEAVDELARAFGGWARVEQVHGVDLVELGGGLSAAASAAGPGDAAPPREAAEPGGAAATRPTAGRADGLLRRGAAAGPRLLTVTVADCVPVYLSWPGGYGLLHAGWRGIAGGILEAAVRRAGAPPAALRIHLGPAIGGCCYEVGPEVEAALFGGPEGREAARDAGALLGRAGPRRAADLRRALGLRAAALGLPPDAVTASASCTACDARLHSFRRGGGAEALRLMLAFFGEPLPG
ncbi:MAG TPA: polyphenol oxidase family protein [Gemmatimonadota bacterium]|jgi:copper oxidase (laccase) domain-containing protein